MSELITIEKLHQDCMWVITLHDGSRNGVDAWEQAVRSYIAEFHNAPERYLVYDTSPIPNLGFTTYLQQRATVLAKDNRDAKGRVAIVLRIPATVLYFFDIFVRITGARIQPYLEVKFFTQRESAVAWVEAALQEKGNAVTA